MFSLSRLIIHAFFTLAIAMAGAIPLRGEDFGFPWPYASSDAADADFRSVTAASPDRVFAVGDRGLSMRSVDGGSSWHRFHLPQAVDLTGVSFANSVHGWICGGFVWPGTLRSQGSVWRTADGGETWQPAVHQDLPRLVGIQAVGSRELICWGDYSLSRGSGLFISRDGGENFDTRPSPCGHIAAAAWADEHRGLVVDRLSRVFVSDGSDGFRQIDLPCSPAMPIVAAHFDGQQFWLAGDGCQLYRSANLRHWTRMPMTLSEDNQALIDFRAVGSADGSVWVATNLSGVVARSGDGMKFSLTELGSRCSLNSLCRVTGEHVIGVGSAAQIVESRNGGVGWWMTHESGQRAGVLAVAATARDVPWDLLANASIGDRRRAEAVVIHGGDAAFAADALPEPAAAVAQAASITAASVECWDRFPIGSLSGTACRPSDLAGYVSDKGQPSAVELALAAAIRSRRPDVVVVCEASPSGEISRRAASATLQAVRLAGDPNLRLFEDTAGVQLPAWKVLRTIRRTPRTGGSGSLADWSIGPDSLLGKSGECVADRIRLSTLLTLRPAELFASIDLPEAKSADHLAALPWNSAALYGDYWLLGGGRRAASHALSIFAGLAEDPDSMRRGEESRLRNLQVLTATIRQQKAVAKLIAGAAPGADAVRGATELAAYVETMPTEDRCRTLADAATVYLHRRDLPMWHATMQLLLAERSENVWTRLGWQQAMQFACSEELMRAARGLPLPADPTSMPPAAQRRGVGIAAAAGTQHAVAAQESTAVVPAAFVSPFEQDNRSAGAIPAAWRGDARQLVSTTVAGASKTKSQSAGEVIRSGGGLPGVAPWLLRMAAPEKLTDRGDMTKLLLARSLASHDGVFGAQHAGLDPAVFVPLIGWPRLTAAENALLRSGTDAKSSSREERLSHFVYHVVQTTPRPRLDGDLHDQCWASAAALPLKSAWQGELPEDSEVRILHDAEFLYIAASCPAFIRKRGPDVAADRDATAREGNGQKRRDADVSECDHLRFRIDVDRDYSTAYEMSIGSDGRTHEACGGVDWWDPQWYVATEQSDDAYRIEAAIPWEELVDGDEPLSDRCFALRVDRQVPGVGAQNLHGLPSDRPLPQTVVLLQFGGAAAADSEAETLVPASP